MSTRPEPGQRHTRHAYPEPALSGQGKLPGTGRLLVVALAVLFVSVSALGVMPSRSLAQPSGVPQAEEEPSEFERANDRLSEAQEEATPEEREQATPGGGDSGDEAPEDEGGGEDGSSNEGSGDEGGGDEGSGNEGSGQEDSSGGDDQTEYGQAQDEFSDALDDASEEEREQATPQGDETENGEAQDRAEEQADESGSEDDEGGDSDRECSLSPDSSYAFQLLSPKDVEHDRSYMVCGVGNYYLSYVDFSNWAQDINPVPDLQDTTYNGFNGLASLAMELNAQMMAMTIDLLNFGLDLNLVETLKSSIDRVVDALGEGFYAVLYTAASVVALVYVMYLFAKGRAQDAGFALIKASFVAFIGLWLTGGQAVALANSVNGYQESLTNAAFSALTGINEDDQSSQALGCDSASQCISANIWDRYVYDPWANLQISENDEIAENERDRILKISNPDDRESELKDLGDENDEVKSVVDMVYATGHFLKAALQLVVSAFFSVLVFTLVFLLIAAEIMMVFFIMSAPIWMVLAIFPAGMLFERFVFYTFIEAAQVFGYKLAIAFHLLFMNTIMTNFGTATGYLLACVLTIGAFVKRKTLYKLLSPTGMVRSLEARYRRGRQIRADAAAARSGGMLGGGGGAGAAAAGTAAATGVPAAGARPVRQSFAEAKAEMESNSFTPESLRSGAATVGAAAAGAGAAGAYRGAMAAPGAVRDGSEAVRAGSDARAEEAMRLHELANKRADDPESLSDAERRELEQAEAMTEAGNDPLKRASIANRGFRKEAMERRRHRKERDGRSTNAALAGPKRDGESERDYLARQQAARRKANEQRRNLSDMAKNRQGFNVGGYPKQVSCASCGKPFMASSAADTVCSVCQRHGSNHGVRTNKCANCGTMLADPNQTLCVRCRGGGGPGGSGGGPGPGPGPTTRTRPGPGVGFYTGTGTGQRPPRFTTSSEGTVSDSGGEARSSGRAGPGESNDDGSPSETAGRPRAADTGAYDGGYADGSYEGTSYEGTSYEDVGYGEGGYEAGGATGGATDSAVDEGATTSDSLTDDGFVGFGHTDPSQSIPVDGEGEYVSGGRPGVPGSDAGGYYADSSEGLNDDSGVMRPRGFEASSPTEPTTTEPEPGRTSMEDSGGSISGGAAYEGTAHEGTGHEGTAREGGNTPEGQRPAADGGYAPQRSLRAQRFSSFGHTALDVAGYIPAAGAVPDLVNAGWYNAEGNRKDAAISAGAAVPLVGDSGKAIADASKTAKAAKIHARADRIERGLDQGFGKPSLEATKSGSTGSVPNSLRPQRFSRDGGSGLWLPEGSNARSGHGSGSGQNPATGAAAGASARASAGKAAAEKPSEGATRSSDGSSDGSASAQRPPVQHSDNKPSASSRDSSSNQSPSKESRSKESPPRESSVREGAAKGTSPNNEPGTTVASGAAGQRPDPVPKPSEPRLSEPKPSEPSRPEKPAQTSRPERESQTARAEVTTPGLQRSGLFPATGSGAQREGGGKSHAAGSGLPDSLQPERFSRQDGGGLWLPGGSGSSEGYSHGSGRQGSAQDQSGSVFRPTPDTSSGGRQDSSRQSQRRTDEGRPSDRGRNNS